MIKYKTSDGGKTVARTASLALFHWYMRIIPELPRPDPMPILEFVEIGNPIPGPYDPMFMYLLIGGVERTFGKSPELDQELFRKEWYDNLPANISNFKVVIKSHHKGNPKVVLYEEACTNALKWLAQHGNITKLEISNEG